MSKINFKLRGIFCHDNLDVLQGMNSGCIDLIYLDPPFNKKKVFTAPIGSHAEGAAFSDIFREEDVKDEWVKSIEYENEELYSYLAGVKTFSNKYNYYYLAYMAIRLIECRRVLKDTGSIYLHCDPTMSHYLKIVMDCIFGEKNFRNEIVWGYRGGGVPENDFARKHDIVMRYSKGGRYRFNKQYVPYSESSASLVEGRGGVSIDGKERDIRRGASMPDWWTDINSLQTWSGERTGYPTQKPLALIERIIKASSGEGDIVLDPFCGCATTCVAAEKLRRQWVGVDISVKAYELVKVRIKKEVSAPLVAEEPFFTTEPPKRDKDAAAGERGFVYIISHRAYPGEWKVGIAKDPEKRVKGYQTGDPKRGYQLEDSFETPHYREVERAVHKHFNAANEWVRADSKEAVIEVIERIIAERGSGPAE